MYGLLFLLASVQKGVFICFPCFLISLPYIKIVNPINLLRLFGSIHIIIFLPFLAMHTKFMHFFMLIAFLLSQLHLLCPQHTPNGEFTYVSVVVSSRSTEATFYRALHQLWWGLLYPYDSRLSLIPMGRTIIGRGEPLVAFTKSICLTPFYVH